MKFFLKYVGMEARYQLPPTVRMLVSSVLVVTSATRKQINRQNQRRGNKLAVQSGHKMRGCR